MIFDSRLCELGEGPLWHPIREQMFWFDINNQKLLSQDRDGPREWRFPEIVSAAGWVSEDVLLIAGERDLFLFDLETEEVETLCLLEQDKPKPPQRWPRRSARRVLDRHDGQGRSRRRRRDLPLLP